MDILKQDFFLAPEVGKQLLYIGITILLAAIINSILRSLIKVPRQFANRKATNAAVIIRNIITFFVYAIAIYTIFTILKIDLSPFLASASIIGIIIGIGARSIIEDFVSGLFYLSLDSLAYGDYVRIGDIEGYVERIGSRTLTIRSSEGALHVFPNSQVKGIANFSRHRSTTLITLPLKANQDIDKMLDAADEALTQLKTERKYAGKLYPESKVNGIGSFEQPEILNLQVSLITKSANRWEIAREYRLLAKKEIEKRKLQFA